MYLIPLSWGFCNTMNMTNMKRFACLMLLVSAISGTSVQAAGPKANPGLKVISYNIRYADAEDGTNSWDFRAGASIEMIKDQKPDVFGLQEALFRQISFLNYFLDEYKSVGVGRDDGRHKGEHMSIFYNKSTVTLKKWGTFWLSETPSKVGPGWDAKHNRTATWALMKDKRTGKMFYFVDTHLDNKGEEAREEGVKTLLSEMDRINAKGLPMIIAGDFNMRPDNPCLRPIRERMKCTREVAALTDSKDTFNSWGKANRQIIDYIWFEGFSSCTEYETVTKPYDGRNFISDHYPIRSILFF